MSLTAKRIRACRPSQTRLPAPAGQGLHSLEPNGRGSLNDHHRTKVHPLRNLYPQILRRGTRSVPLILFTRNARPVRRFVLSQKHEGWKVLPGAYDDGGFSGGNMDRPGLKRLLEDITAGKVDTVVVYKVDRLTRALSDFARIVESFDSKGGKFRLGNSTVQHHELHGPFDLKCAALVCPIRAGGDR